MSDSNNLSYYLDSKGAIWVGPMRPNGLVHYGRYEGTCKKTPSVDPEDVGRPIVVLTRSHPGLTWVLIGQPASTPRLEAYRQFEEKARDAIVGCLFPNCSSEEAMARVIVAREKLFKKLEDIRKDEEDNE